MGGGYGTLVLTILQAHPALRGVVLDREHAMAGARQKIAAHGCAERCEAVAGDLFQAVPGDSVTFSFAGAGKPLLIRGAGDRTFSYIVMPMNR